MYHGRPQETGMESMRDATATATGGRWNVGARGPHDVTLAHASTQDLTVLVATDLRGGVRERLHELLAPLEQQSTQPRDSVELTAVDERAVRVHGPPGLSIPPPTNGIKVLERKTERIDEAVTHRTAGVGLVLHESLAHSRGRAGRRRLLEVGLDVGRWLRRR